MTRYTRAKGSKASNERTPNDATPWHVMKQQLVENLSKHQESSEKTKSIKQLLQEDQDIFSSDKSRDNNWAEFENNCENKINNFTIKKTKKKQNIQLNITQNHDVSLEKCNENYAKITKKSLKRNVDEVDNFETEIKNKKQKKDKNQPNNVNDSQKKETQNNLKINELDIKIDKLKKKKARDKHNITEKESVETSVKNTNSFKIKKDRNNETNNVYDSRDKAECTLSKRQKRNMKRKSNTDSEDVNNDIKMHTNRNKGENENKENNQMRKFNKKFVTESKNFRNVPQKFNVKKFENNKNKKKLPKIRDNQEHKRRKPDLGSSRITINGVEIEIVKYDGFPIKKEDASRLSDLKQKMIMKGIPENEINAAMKLERRKAEKALARIRRCVCFHCRKAGHNLSDCPELGAEQASTGICFKCGSTEHTHFECKVAKPTEFRYATCFICREQGHIAKQCPDNPKGVYPQGGCCKICGDVTHLKKDCPDLIKEKEKDTITVNTIANSNIESLEENTKIQNEKDDKISKKIVKF